MTWDTWRSARPLKTRAVAALVPGATEVEPVAVTISAGTAPGSYFLIAVADDGTAVSETDEANNTRAKAPRTPCRPDGLRRERDARSLGRTS